MSSFSQRKKNRSAMRGSAFWRDLFLVMTISLIFHGLIFLMVSLIPPEGPAYKDKSVTLFTDIEPELEDILMPEFDIEVPELDALAEVDLSDMEPQIEEEVPLEELLDIEEIATDEPDSDDGLDMFEDLSDDEGTGLESLAMLGMDFSQSVGDGLPSAYSGRTGKEKSKKTKQYGGSQKVLDAVDRALAWLAAHQSADGSWKFMPGVKVVPAKKDHVKKEVPKKAPKVGGEEKKEGEKAKVKDHIKDVESSITASAVLAFLGAGHNESSGPYRKNVRNAIRYLNEVVAKNVEKKSIGRNYGSALILMALSESSIFGSSPSTKRNANILAQKFMESYKGKGWGYSGGGDDFSVSGWVALGLKSARQAEVEAVSDEKIKALFSQYGKWVNEMTNPKTGYGNYRPDKKGNIAMSWVGMFQKQFLGFPSHDPFLVKASELGVASIKSVFDMKKVTWKNEYALYYGTLASFQQQGTFWKKWNVAMQETLTATQREGLPEELGGSWDPGKGSIGDSGGRVMSTALLTLCLEVYYRYAMMH